jgi:hypothetical protein
MRWSAALVAALMLPGCIRIYRWTDWSASEASHRVERDDEAMFASNRALPVDILVVRRDGEVLQGRLMGADEAGLKVGLGPLSFPLPKRFDVLAERAQTLHGAVLTLTWDEVDRIVVRRYDKALSVFVTTLIGVVAGGGAVAGITVGALLATASCPLVSVEQPDGTWEVVGEAYAGSIYQALERLDAVPLPEPEAGSLSVRLTRIPGELERLDVVSLWAVAHGAGERALSGPDGRVRVVGEVAPPRAAADLTGQDALAAVSAEDARWWGVAVPADPLDGESRSGLVVEVPSVPSPALVLTVQTTPVQDLAVMELWRALGPRAQSKFAGWGAEPGRRSAGLAFRDASGLDLRVEAWDGSGWTVVGAVPPVGWRAPRTVAVPLPEGTTRARVTAATAQWLVDAAGVATVVDADPPVEALAADEPLLERSDDARLVLDGERPDLTLRWELPAPPAGRSRSLFLAAEGYYDLMVDEAAEPDPKLVRHVLGSPEELARLGLVAAAWGPR